MIVQQGIMTSGVSEVCWFIYCYRCTTNNNNEILHASRVRFTVTTLDHCDLSITNLSTNVPTLLLDEKATTINLLTT